MKIYIAGKITDEPLEACKAKFAEAEQQLRDIGVNPVNPFKLGIPETAPREYALPFCFKALRHCNGIFMLNDWVNSPGSLAELAESIRFKLDVFYEADGDYERLADCVKIEYVRG